MTQDDFITLVKQPEQVNEGYISDLKEMTERYPYFVHARLLHVKGLRQSHSIHYAANLKGASIYCSSRRWFYYYLHPEKLLSTEPYQRNKQGQSSGDYFDMIKNLESDGGATRQSLKNLAERLKSARALVVVPKVQPPKKTTSEKGLDILKPESENVSIDLSIKEIIPSEIEEISENNAKKLIRERKYAEAIEILRALNLNNPKKSVYFADQIRFLEKVIVNSKK